jgi:bifunctional non-homologous end joining protein LigD
VFAATVWSDRVEIFEQCRDLGMEGVIAKRAGSLYHPGRRSPDWIKFKALHRVSCVPTAYERGEGSRSHFGAMHLAMVGPTGPVPVGRVGTGFTEREITDLKGRIDRGELFVVEIECLNVTKGGVLRFPVYKGVRSDLSPLDATIDQLGTLPRC